MGNSKVSSVSQHESHNLILMLDLLFSGSIQSEKLRVLSLSSSSSPFVLATEKPAKKIGENGKESFLELKGNLVEDFSMFSWTYCLAYETQKRDTEAFEKRGESLGQIFAIVQKVGFRTLIPLEKQGRKESITTDFFLGELHDCFSVSDAEML